MRACEFGLVGGGGGVGVSVLSERARFGLCCLLARVLYSVGPNQACYLGACDCRVAGVLIGFTSFFYVLCLGAAGFLYYLCSRR